MSSYIASPQHSFSIISKKKQCGNISKMCDPPSRSIGFQKRDEEDKLSCIQQDM